MQETRHSPKTLPTLVHRQAFLIRHMGKHWVPLWVDPREPSPVPSRGCCNLCLMCIDRGILLECLESHLYVLSVSSHNKWKLVANKLFIWVVTLGLILLYFVDDQVCYITLQCVWVSELLLFIANFSVYHGENKLIFNEMMAMFALY